MFRETRVRRERTADPQMMMLSLRNSDGCTVIGPIPIQFLFPLTSIPRGVKTSNVSTKDPTRISPAYLLNRCTGRREKTTRTARPIPTHSACL